MNFNIMNAPFVASTQIKQQGSFSTSELPAALFQSLHMILQGGMYVVSVLSFAGSCNL